MLDHEINIWYSNNVPALANHFIHHLLERLEQVVQTNSVCLRIRNTYLEFNCSSNLAQKFVSFDWGGYTKHSETKIEFVQITTGQAVMPASQWLKLEHCSSASWRLHGPLLPASVLNTNKSFVMQEKTDAKFHKRLHLTERLLMLSSFLKVTLSNKEYEV